MEPINLCPLCGAPAPAPPVTICRYCNYSWAGQESNKKQPTTVDVFSTPQVPIFMAPSASFRGLSFEETLEAAKLHFRSLQHSDLFFAPDIPKNKEQGARRIHSRGIPEEEPLVVLYDSTLFGSAEDGFLITPRRFCWKNYPYNPQSLPWRSIQLDELGWYGSDLQIMGNTVQCYREDLAEATHHLLHALGTEAQKRMPINHSMIINNTDGILDLIRLHLKAMEELYLAPNLPEKKLQNVQAIHKIGPEEQVLAIYDDTVFGSAEEGIVFTNQRICWKNLLEDPQAISWIKLRGSKALPWEKAPPNGLLPFRPTSRTALDRFTQLVKAVANNTDSSVYR